MPPAAAALGVLAVVNVACALLPDLTSALFGYRVGERLAISIGAISCIVDVMRPIRLRASFL